MIQKQTLNDMMKVQLNSYSMESVMILGIAGGNGLEYQINTDKEFVSESLYLHVFDGLSNIHHQMEKR